MENPEEVLHSLDEFAKLKPKDIPRELEEYLSYVAKTGDPVYQWSLVKCLFREKMLSVITDFYESCPSIDLPPCPNVDPFNYETMKSSLLERLDSFANAPFTVQRLCELLTTPRKEYTRVDKFMRAIEKNILVVSTKEPGAPRRNNDNAQPEFLMNGVMEGRGLDIGEAIETVSSEGVNLMHGVSTTDAALADTIRVECEEMDMEENAAADVAVAAVAVWDKPVAECEVKTETSPVEEKPAREVTPTTATPVEFTPEVFGQAVDLGTAAVDASPGTPVVLSVTSAAPDEPKEEPSLLDPQTEPQSQIDQEQVAAVCSITEDQQEEEVTDAPIIAEIITPGAELSEEQLSEIPQEESTLHAQDNETQQSEPAVSESETDKGTPDSEASTSVESDAEPVSVNTDSNSGGGGDATDRIASPVQANLNDEATMDVPSGMLKGDSLMKSLEAFTGDLTGLDSTSTQSFSELTTDEDTQDAVRGSDQLDEDDEDSMDVREEGMKESGAAEDSEETRMEVDPHEEEVKETPKVEEPTEETVAAEKIPEEKGVTTEEKPAEPPEAAATVAPAESSPVSEPEKTDTS